MSLDEIRSRIDRIDADIIRLLDLRARAGREVGAAKTALGLPLHNPGREGEVLARLRRLSDGSMPPAALDAIYRTIMRETLALQQPPPCAGQRAGKADVDAVVVDNAAVAPGFYRMRLRASALAGAFAPGQFFQIRVDDGAGLFLRRPFAPSEYTDDGFAFVYAVVGQGTRRLAGMRSGDAARVIAPLGTGFSLPPAGSTAALLGGGCGAPSLVPLAAALTRAGTEVHMFLAARSADLLLERDAFAAACGDRLCLATDDGTAGTRGTGVDAFRAVRDGGAQFDRVYAIGPTPMLRAVAAAAAETATPCEVSLEERMACGFGACMGCVVPVRTDDGASAYRRVCHDGPVFNAASLAWEDFGT